VCQDCTGIRPFFLESLLQFRISLVQSQLCGFFRLYAVQKDLVK
jgi:hypothetical protein